MKRSTAALQRTVVIGEYEHCSFVWTSTRLNIPDLDSSVVLKSIDEPQLVKPPVDRFDAAQRVSRIVLVMLKPCRWVFALNTCSPNPVLFWIQWQRQRQTRSPR